MDLADYTGNRKHRHALTLQEEKKVIKHIQTRLHGRCVAEKGRDMGSAVTPPSSQSLPSQRQLEKPEEPSLPKALVLVVGEGQALPCAAMGAGDPPNPTCSPASPLMNPPRRWGHPHTPKPSKKSSLRSNAADGCCLSA